MDFNGFNPHQNIHLDYSTPSSQVAVPSHHPSNHPNQMEIIKDAQNSMHEIVNDVSIATFSAPESFQHQVTNTVSTPKRSNRKSMANRSPQHDEDDDIVVLDVYSTFLTNPAILLQQPQQPLPAKKSKQVQQNHSNQPFVMPTRKLNRPIDPRNLIIRTTPGDKASQGVWSKDLQEGLGYAGWPLVQWRGNLLDFPEDEFTQALEPEELIICRVMRMIPSQFYEIKRRLLEKASQEGNFKKRDIKRMFKVDVNKISKLFDIAVVRGWIPPEEDN